VKIYITRSIFWQGTILSFYLQNFIFVYSTFGNYLNFCADLAKRRGAMSGLRHGVPQEVRNTLPSVQYVWRGKPSDIGAGGGRDRAKRYHWRLKSGDLSDRMRR